MKVRPITDADIAQAERQERLSAQSYHKGLIDFTKWTSTLATAATLWVGNVITKTVGLSRAFAMASCASLVISLVFAIFVIKRVLQAWAKEWVVATEDYSLLLLKKLKAIEPGKVTKEEEIEQIKRLLSAIDATKPFSKPSAFKVLLTCHIAFLTLGLLLYLVSQILITP